MFICRDSHRSLVRISLVCSTMRLRASWIRPRLTARNTGTTITTNDTSSVTVTGAGSSLSASQSGTAIQSKAFVAYCSNNTELQNVFIPQPPQFLAVQTLETRLASGVIYRWTLLLTLVKGNRSHLLCLYKSSRSPLLTLCEGSRQCLMFLFQRSR